MRWHTLARFTIQHIIRMHSQACYMSYQLWHIHISLPWCSQPNRNGEIEPSLSFLYSSFFLPLYPHFLLTSLFTSLSNSPSCFASNFLPSLSNRPYPLYLPLVPLFLVSSHFLPPPLSSPFHFSLSSLCSPLTPSSERPIRLHRGFTAPASEGKPKWNAAHLLE